MKREIQIKDVWQVESKEDKAAEILKGLTQVARFIPSKYFYDERGSQLFEEITRLPEYYPTRTEKALLRRHAASLIEKPCEIVELGSGDPSKISIILRSLGNLQGTKYIPVDVSRSAIEKSCNRLRFPYLEMEGLVADFSCQLNYLPEKQKRRFFLFFGSTIGNMTRDGQMVFMNFISSMLQEDDRFICSFDMVKDRNILEAAYNDIQDKTMEFNRNILNHVNTILDSDFQPERFAHRAIWNYELNRIEMYLIALSNMKITTPLLKNPINFALGETIHTENSHKFTPQNIDLLAQESNLAVEDSLMDEKDWFRLVAFTKKS